MNLDKLSYKTALLQKEWEDEENTHYQTGRQHMKNKVLKAVITFIAMAFLVLAVGCGGGGGSETTTGSSGSTTSGTLTGSGQ